MYLWIFFVLYYLALLLSYELLGIFIGIYC